jgi:hypothetical protein
VFPELNQKTIKLIERELEQLFFQKKKEKHRIEAEKEE